jgi:hypothetical protein
MSVSTDSSQQYGIVFNNFHLLTIEARLELILSGGGHLCDINGIYYPLLPQNMTTTAVEGKCLGFSVDGDLLIENVNDLKNPYYMTNSFFGDEDLYKYLLYVGHKIRFSYGVLIEGSFTIRLL